MTGRGRPLPSYLAQKWGNLPYLKYRGNGLWTSACPQCGDVGHIGSDDPDRWQMWEQGNGGNARGWCRSCRHFEWADEGVDDASSPSPEFIEKTRRERERLERIERERMEKKIKRLEEQAYWRGWHDAMGEQQWDLWRQQGIVDYFIQYYRLGYCPSYNYQHGGESHSSPSMTIPHFGPDWHLTNIQHRLLEPIDGAGKYRQLSGLPAALFRTEPEMELSNPTLVVEGAKKAIVLYQHLGDKYQGRPLTIVGIPSKHPSQQMMDELKDADPVYLALDPDAYMRTRADRIPTINRVVKRMGKERSVVVQLPAKPDDMFTQYECDAETFRFYLRQGRRAS